MSWIINEMLSENVMKPGDFILDNNLRNIDKSNRVGNRVPRFLFLSGVGLNI